jgi:hypothetical protein
LEIAELRGLNAGNSDHPKLDLIRTVMSALNAPTADAEAMELLAIWVTKATPELPCISADNVCSLAARIREKALNFIEGG